MALSRFRIPVKTAADGSFETEVHAQGALRAVAIDIGDLSTPDVTITDTFDDTDVFADTGIAGDARYYPTTDDPNSADGEGFPAPMIIQRATVTVAGGGNAKSGVLYLMIER